MQKNSKYPVDWSPDGRFLLYQALDVRSNVELWIVPLEGERSPLPFIQSRFGATMGQFSPDGRWVAYASNESGRWEIYVTSFPTPGTTWRAAC